MDDEEAPLVWEGDGPSCSSLFLQPYTKRYLNLGGPRGGQVAPTSVVLADRMTREHNLVYTAYIHGVCQESMIGICSHICVARLQDGRSGAVSRVGGQSQYYYCVLPAAFLPSWANNEKPALKEALGAKVAARCLTQSKARPS